MKHDTKFYHSVVGGIGKSIRILANAYSIPQSSLSFWFKKIRDEKPVRPTLGPQDKMSDTVKNTTLDVLKSRGNSSNAVARSGELKRIIEDQIEEESLSNALIKNNTISDRAVRAFRVSYDVVALTPKAKTGARIRNEALWHWWFTTDVIPFGVKIRKKKGASDYEIFLTMDGEKILLDSLFNGVSAKSNDFLDKLRAEKVLVGKIPASSSAVLQANDAELKTFLLSEP